MNSSGVFQALAQQRPSRGESSVSFGLTYESTDAFGKQVCEAADATILESGGEVRFYQNFTDTAAPGQNVFTELQESIQLMDAVTPPIDVFVLCGLAGLFPQARNIFNTIRPTFKAGVFVGQIDRQELYSYEANMGYAAAHAAVRPARRGHGIPRRLGARVLTPARSRPNARTRDQSAGSTRTYGAPSLRCPRGGAPVRFAGFR